MGRSLGMVELLAWRTRHARALLVHVSAPLRCWVDGAPGAIGTRSAVLDFDGLSRDAQHSASGARIGHQSLLAHLWR
eukprot:4881461-Pyramimonas_sp.AAC.1